MGIGCSWWGRVWFSGIWPKIKLLEKISDSESRRYQSLQRVYFISSSFILSSFCVFLASLNVISCTFAIFYLYCVIRSFSCLLCVLKLKVIFAFVLSLCVSVALSSLYIFLWVFCDCSCFVSVCSAFTLNHTVVVVFSSSLVSLESIHSLKLLLSLHLYGYFCHFALQTTTNTTRQ